MIRVVNTYEQMFVFLLKTIVYLVIFEIKR